MSTSTTRAGSGRLVGALALGGLVWALAYAMNERIWPWLLGWTGLDLDGRWGSSIEFFLYDSVKILLLLTGLIFVIGMLRTALRAERVRTFLEGRGLGVSLVLAAMLGAVTPFCSCSSIPLFIGFVAAGIPLSVTLTFLIASPLINEVAVVMLAQSFGWPVTIGYVGAGMALAIGAGWGFSRFDLTRWVEPFVFTTPTATLAAADGRPTVKQRVDAAKAETREIVGRVWKWVLVGVGIGAGIHGWVPAQFFADYAGPDNPFGVVIATVVAIPLYSNAAGVIPIAQALSDKGVAIGTVMSFMMATVALSLPEFVLLKRVLKLPLLLIFFGTVAVGIIAIGLIFNLTA
jgi:uncharacterized membrane protein YraQ (UPF0718 family)